jgi:putative intracellular protease/amidase
LRVDGIVTAVCTEMGCWLALGAADNPDQAVRFQADHDGKIVFPLTLKGKQASAEGVFIKIAADDKEATEAAGEHAASQPKAAGFGRRYQFQVTGAVAP